jgi:predicted component of type VI protein secretion system
MLKTILVGCRLERKTKTALPRISRRHFELRRRPDGFVLRALSDSATHLNGRLVAEGETRKVCLGDAVRVGNVLTVQFPALEAELETAGGQQIMIFSAARP